MNDTDRIALLRDGAYAALDAIRAELDNAKEAADKYPETFSGSLWGDHIDYTNAAVDQIRWITDLLNGDRPLTDLDALFTRTRDDLQNDADSCVYGFVYGYADHGSPISDKMIANDDDEE